MTLKYEHLVGRRWMYGETDCFDIGIRFFADNYGVEIPNYARPNDWWTDPAWNLYEELALESGFVKVDRTINTAHPGDISLICIYYPQPCHAVVHLEKGRILHHPINQLSQAPSPIPSYIRKGWACTLRHRDIPEHVEDTGESFDLMAALSPAKRAKYQAVLESQKKI